MASSVFFRFKSQREPSRVAFDGTGISVFELKRDIISQSRLGDGKDFELVLSSNDNNDVYDDDTAIVPRSTTVIAKRLPAIKPGKGGAARYVSGKMPLNAKNPHRSENTAMRNNERGDFAKAASGVPDVNNLQTEAEREAAVLQMGAEQWKQQQEEMANVTPVHRVGLSKRKPANVPDHPPPPIYVCHKCYEKGHWIDACPAWNDPNWKDQPRVKRTTGIPRSFLKIVDKPTAMASDGTTDDMKRIPGVMVNADGEWVVAEPDKASWERYAAKTKVSAAAQEEVARSSKEIHDRGLECAIDKRLYVDPTKTPCCQTTYCNECITNALLDDDLQCPSCGRDGILIDDLKPDLEMMVQISKYEAEKASETKEPKEKEATSLGDSAITQERSSTSPREGPRSRSPEDNRSSAPMPSSLNRNEKKRPANSVLENTRMAPSLNGQPDPTKSEQKPLQQSSTTQGPVFPPELSFMNQPAFSIPGVMPGLSSVAFPNVNGFMGMPLSMAPLMGMNPGMANPMMVPNGTLVGGVGTQWNNVAGMFPNQQNGTYGNLQGNIAMNGAYGIPDMQMPMKPLYGSMSGTDNGGHRGGSFANQQRTTFGSSRSNAEDSAYFRQPVNPYRHQNKRNTARPTDYREI